MKYNFKIYNVKTQQVYSAGITNGRGSRTEQTRHLKDVRVSLINQLGIGHFSKEAENIKISMRSIGFDDGSNIR
jgi:hypothetical protein